MDTAYIQHPDCLLHDAGAGHPERPARLSAIDDQLIASGLINYLRHEEAPKAQRKHLERIHEPPNARMILASGAAGTALAFLMLSV